MKLINNLKSQKTIQMKFLTRIQLAKQLSVTPRTIANWSANGYITPIKIGKKTLRFDLEAVLIELNAKSSYNK